MKKHYNSLENRIVDTLVLIICVCIFVICILPLINVLALSFSGKEAAIAGKYLYGQLILLWIHINIYFRKTDFFYLSGCL